MSTTTRPRFRTGFHARQSARVSSLAVRRASGLLLCLLVATACGDPGGPDGGPEGIEQDFCTINNQDNGDRYCFEITTGCGGTESSVSCREAGYTDRCEVDNGSTRWVEPGKLCPFSPSFCDFDSECQSECCFDGFCRPESQCNGGGGGGIAEGSPCSSAAQCAAGLDCMRYLGNPSNDLLCLRPCSSHDDCVAAISPNFTSPFSACWNCSDTSFGGPGPGEAQCVPLNICGFFGGGGASCNECLSSCSGLPSCCTGTGCICDSECPG